MKTPEFIIKWKIFKMWIASKGLKYDLYMPTNRKEVIHSIEMICANNKLPQEIKGDRDKVL